MEIEGALVVALLVWMRAAPLFVLVPYLAWGAAPGLAALALSLGFACVAAPLCALGSVPVPSSLWVASASELARGGVIALGCGVPFMALRVTGAIADACLDAPAELAAQGGRLARVCGLAAVAIAAGHEGVSGALRMLLDLELLPPLGTGLADHFDPLRGLCTALAQLLVGGVAIGITLSAPILLAQIVIGWLTGALGRLLSAARLGPPAFGLSPWLGLALVSLVFAHWLDAVPQLVRTFAQSAARLLAGLP